MAEETSVLFVCLGNICRSPMAEAIFRDLLTREGLDGEVRVDSAGTGSWHVGEAPDRRARREAAEHGLRMRGAARQVRAEDLRTFDYVVAMDRENLEELEKLSRAAGGTATLHLLREFDDEAGVDLDLPDPYFGGPGGFRRVFEMEEKACRGLLEKIRKERIPS